MNMDISHIIRQNQMVKIWDIEWIIIQSTNE